MGEDTFKPDQIPTPAFQALELPIEKLRTIDDLARILAEIPGAPKEWRAVVSLLIFTPEGNLLLLKRGEKARDNQGQLEAVGGALDPEDGGDLLAAAQRETKEEIGDVSVSIEQVIGLKFLFRDTSSSWVVVEYAGRLTAGTPTNKEPKKIESIETVSLAEVDEVNLSQHQRTAMTMYYQKFGKKPFYKSD
jgi:ADP-ribose pyrophosphatase YjhB (NUDIX family)